MSASEVAAFERITHRIHFELTRIQRDVRKIRDDGTTIQGTRYPAAELADRVAELGRVVADLVTALEDHGCGREHTCDHATGDCD